MTQPNDTTQPIAASFMNEKGDLSTFGYLPTERGLTKREYFAALAMQGLLSNPDFVAHTPLHAAEWAVSNADALIETLNKYPTQP